MQPAELRPSWTTVSSDNVEWLDIEDPTQEDILALARRYPFHPLNLEDCLSKRQLTRVEDHQSHVFILLHFPSLSQKGLVVRDQVTIFVGETYVVSLHGSDLPLPKEMAQGLNRDDDLRASTTKSSAYLAYAIIDKLVDGIFPLLDKFRNDLDSIEDEVFDERVSAAGAINRIRRQIADLRRIVLPMRRTLTDSSARLGKYATKDLSAYFKDILDHVDKVHETLEEMKETIEIYKDTNFILTTDQTNRVLAVLTIIFTLSIPATVVGAIYGMNVPLPWGNGENPPTFLGPYTTFIFLLAAMALPSALMAWYFRRLGWI